MEQLELVKSASVHSRRWTRRGGAASPQRVQRRPLGTSSFGVLATTVVAVPTATIATIRRHRCTWAEIPDLRCELRFERVFE